MSAQNGFDSFGPSAEEIDHRHLHATDEVRNLPRTTDNNNYDHVLYF